jgi:dolichyl-phosphate beta-glucosyltransferase
MLSVIIAAYNEEKRLEKTLRAITAFIDNQSLDAEIIVVNDGSRDGTSQILDRLKGEMPRLAAISYHENRGKGYALRQGVLASRGDLVLLTDADLSTPMEEFEKLAQTLVSAPCDIAIGSRALQLSRILRQQPWWRRTMGKTFNRIVKTVVLDGFEDTQCGFKLFRGPAARELFGRAVIDRFAFDVEILCRARQEGLRIEEIPVVWSNAPGSKVNPVTDSARMFLDTLRIRFLLGSAKTDNVGLDAVVSQPKLPDKH